MSKMQELKDKLLSGQISNQGELNALLIQLVIDLDDRLQSFEKPEDYNKCCVCNSPFVIGVIMDNDEACWFCFNHSPGNVIIKEFQ